MYTSGGLFWPTWKGGKRGQKEVRGHMERRKVHILAKVYFQVPFEPPSTGRGGKKGQTKEKSKVYFRFPFS